MKTAFSFLLFFASVNAFAQLGFCTGSKGDPIFHEDFGSGSGTGPALENGVTNYTYVTEDPQDGQYTISDHISAQITSWHNYLPKTTLSNGRALIVNADYTAGRFFQKKISGLCESTTYEFSAFLMNIYNAASDVCEAGGIPVNVKFEIWDATDTQLLKSGSTGDINSTRSPQWGRYALTFQSEPGQNGIILKMYNNGDGGCGNDLAIDDIIFRSCGDLTEITAPGLDGNEYAVCRDDAPVSLNLTATPDNSVYDQHAFQWQESSDGSSWTNIPGETSANLQTAALNSSKYFRVKVAEDQVNLSNNLCSSASEPVFVHIIETPSAPVSNGDRSICGGEAFPALSVQSGAGETVNWYDAASGGNLLGSGNSFTPASEGTFYTEAVNTGYDCTPSQRTPISLKVNPVPELQDEDLQICPNSSLQLDAGVPGMKYSWSTGEKQQKINVSAAGNYQVTVTTSAGCSVTKDFQVTAVDDAQIEDVISEGSTVTVKPVAEGDFEYSLDGINYQASNIFKNVKGGIYTAYMRDLQHCKTVTREFPHILAPAFITPNHDGYNDVFEMRGIEYFESSEIEIYDRYGKLLKQGSGAGFRWNGTFNGKDLPADDYWYSVNIKGFGEIKGHFSLKR